MRLASPDTHEEMSIGVKLLDCDHRQQFETILELQDLISRGRRPSRIGFLLRRLERFTRVHFALEEGMMKATNYPGLKDHALCHSQIAEHLRALVIFHDKDALNLVPGSLDFLTTGHMSHVEHDDLSYGLWLDRSGQWSVGGNAGAKGLRG
jgi:hemerythrin